MKRFVTLFLVMAICLTMMIPSSLPSSAASGESISLMTYNIAAFGVPGEAISSSLPDESLYIANRYQSVLDVMYMPDGSEPDIICLTEVNNTWGPYLVNELFANRGYSRYGVSSNGISNLNSGTGQWDLFNMIFYKSSKYKAVDKGRFWCSDTPTYSSVYSGGDFARCINWVKLQSLSTGRQFFVACAHIDAKSASVREKSATQIATTMNDLAGGLPVIMMGDWNCKSSSTAYKNITGNGFNDAKSIASSSSGGNTYVGFDGSKGSVIDHCFLSKNLFTVSQYNVITTKMSNGYYPSDHRPVAVEAIITSVAPTASPVPTASPTPKPTASPTPVPTATPYVDPFELDSSSSYIKDDTNKVIKGVTPETSADDFLFNFVNLDLLIMKNGEEIYGNIVVGTGTVITDGTTEYTAVQIGDINGDGKVATADYMLIKKGITGYELSTSQSIAADIDGNGSIATSDYMKVKRYILGSYDLYQ